MLRYDTPGVYHERRDGSDVRIDALRTDVAAFVGIAERGPIGLPVPIESWRQFEAHFGGFTEVGYLAYVVRGFFENGGRRCWVVRVGSDVTVAAATQLSTAAGPCWRVEASSPGVWGNELQLRVVERRRQRARGELTPSSRDFVQVDSTAGFQRFDFVALIQGAFSVEYRAIAYVDPGERRLYFTETRSERPMPYFSAVPSSILPGAPVRLETLSYALEVREAGRLLRVYDELSVVPDHPRHGPRLLPAAAERAGEGGFSLRPLPEPIAIRQLEAAVAPTLLPLSLSALAAGSGRVQLSGGADGLSTLAPRDFIGEVSAASERGAAVEFERRGLAALAPVSEISMVAIPDIHIAPRDLARALPPAPCVVDACRPAPALPAAPALRSRGDLPPRFGEAAVALVQSALVLHCEERKDRVALLDAPLFTVERPALGVAGIQLWRQSFDSTYAALYFPWLEVVDPLRLAQAPTLRIPPCGHVAGQIAELDIRAGAHRAPANVALNWVQDLTFAVDDALHGELNPRGINAIRALSGRAIRVFGARTLTSETSFRFLNVRRLLISIRRALDAALQWAAFEPNNWLTRLKIDLSIRTYLRTLWEQGALMGAVPEEAFFVQCDDANNPAPLRDTGRLLAEIGVAPSVPFEFVVVRVGRQNNSFEYAEAGNLVMGA